jgi:hypothetical protein
LKDFISSSSPVWHLFTLSLLPWGNTNGNHLPPSVCSLCYEIYAQPPRISVPSLTFFLAREMLQHQEIVLATYYLNKAVLYILFFSWLELSVLALLTTKTGVLLLENFLLFKINTFLKLKSFKLSFVSLIWSNAGIRAFVQCIIFNRLKHKIICLVYSTKDL